MSLVPHQSNGLANYSTEKELRRAKRVWIQFKCKQTEFHTVFSNQRNEALDSSRPEKKYYFGLSLIWEMYLWRALRDAPIYITASSRRRDKAETDKLAENVAQLLRWGVTIFNIVVSIIYSFYHHFELWLCRATPIRWY